MKNSQTLSVHVFSHTLNTSIMLVLRVLVVHINLFEEQDFAVVRRTFKYVWILDLDKKVEIILLHFSSLMQGFEMQGIHLAQRVRLRRGKRKAVGLYKTTLLLQH